MSPMIVVCVSGNRCGAILDMRPSKNKAAHPPCSLPAIAGSLLPLPRHGARTHHCVQIALARRRLERSREPSRSLLSAFSVNVNRLSFFDTRKFKHGDSAVPLPFVVELLSSSYVRCTQRFHCPATTVSYRRANTSAFEKPETETRDNHQRI